MFNPRFVLRSFQGEENAQLSGKILQTLLTALVSINLEIMADRQRKGYAVPLLYESGIRYVRDGESNRPGFGPEDWQDVTELLHRKSGDCKSLAAYRAAEIIFRSGGKVKAFPQFRWRDRHPGSLYHIVVQLPDGTIEDPSALLGMTDRRHY